MKGSRRKFIKDSVASLALASLNHFNTFASHSNASNKWKIDSIELFRYDINIPRYFSWGTWHNRQHLFMKISSGKYYGWSEVPASKNNPDFIPVEWEKYLKQYIGLDIYSARELLLSQQVIGTSVSAKKLEFIQIGLLDLAGRIENRPAIEILGLNGRNPVPGLYCILQKDIEKVKQLTRECLEQNLNHLKFKMFGDKELDRQILKIIRKEFGNESVVISDVNQGYKKWDSLDDLAIILNDFNINGLDAIEDPAPLEIPEWVKLQKLTGELSLIPDKPLRLAWKSLEEIKPGMGRIYNLHPSVMGSFTHSAKLAQKISDFGAKVMIGDDSLVGPACTAWQQIAIGTGATWVEAIEKKGDSDHYLDCVVSRATTTNPDGTFGLNPKPGFGLEMDEEKLKKICAYYKKLLS